MITTNIPGYEQGRIDLDDGYYIWHLGSQVLISKNCTPVAWYDYDGTFDCHNPEFKCTKWFTLFKMYCLKDKVKI